MDHAYSKKLQAVEFWTNVCLQSARVLIFCAAVWILDIAACCLSLITPKL